MPQSKYRTVQTDWPTVGIIFIILIAAAIPSVFFLDTSTFVPILTIIVIISIMGSSTLVWYSYLTERRKVRAFTLSHIDTLKGEEFERYLGEVLKTQGYTVAYTKQSGDFGTDIVAMQGNDRYSIQVKRYNHSVNRSAISDAVAGMAYYHCNKCMVITTNYFTKQAIEFAQANNCELIDRDTLSAWILAFQTTR